MTGTVSSGKVLTREEAPFDPDALRDRYRAERDKRIRADGNEQYLQIAGRFADFGDDPYIEAPIQRAPLTDEVEVVVIGGGFGGLLAGARLREAGVKSLRMIEAAGDFGGTWYWNRYPGAACDIESLVYLPLLEETGFIPEMRYTKAPEIFEHSRRIARHFNLYEDACFQTSVKDLSWDEAAQRWIITTNHGDAMRARFVVMSNGPLNKPKLPGIPGIETFKGHAFHTSRWDYEYTGGSVLGGLDRIGDKRIGIIGTGATAVQCVPHLAEGAGQLYVFQRTPSAVNVRNDQPIDADWVRSLPPGWQNHRMDNFNLLVSGGYAEEDLVNDGWTEAFRELVFIARKEGAAGLSPEKLAELMEIADFATMERIRARAEAVVNDPATAEALKPWYRQFCKRPCFHDEYLQAFNRPSVKLVDTQGKGVERITENAVVVDGVAYEIDCLIFSTGFEVGTSFSRRYGYDIHGRGGQPLSQAWANGVRSLHGLMVRGFPNLFFLGSTQGGFTANYPHNLREQAAHATYVIDQVKARQGRAAEPSEQAESDWVATIIDKARNNQAYLEACTPGYYNNEGKPYLANAQNTNYGGGPIEYFRILADWRASGDLPGLEVS